MERSLVVLTYGNFSKFITISNEIFSPFSLMNYTSVWMNWIWANADRNITLLSVIIFTFGDFNFHIFENEKHPERMCWYDAFTGSESTRSNLKVDMQQFSLMKSDFLFTLCTYKYHRIYLFHAHFGILEYYVSRTFCSEVNVDDNNVNYFCIMICEC